MNKSIIQYLYLITGFLFFTNANADIKPSYSFTPHQIASLSWGNQSREVALSKAPANNFGPPSFAVNDAGSTVYLLDAANERLVVINQNTFSTLTLPSNQANDLCLLDNRLYLLFGEQKQVIVYNFWGRRLKTYPLPDSPLSLQCHTDVIVETFNGEFYRLNAPTVPIKPPYTVKRTSSSQWRVRRSEPLIINSGTVESLDIIGVDQTGNLYIAVEELINEGLQTENVKRFLRQYSPSGEWLAEVELPYSLYAYTLKDLIVTAAGDVYQILPLKNSFEIIQWRRSQGQKFKRFSVSNYSEKLFSHTEEHPDDFYPSETPDNENIRQPGRTKAWQSGITREAILSKAKEYANYSFQVKAHHLTPRRGSGRKVIITPITQTGQYTGIPYKWGGNDSLERFQKGLRLGKKVGDKCTAKHARCRGQYFGNPQAIGVDCSGLISQVWGLKSKYSTRGLPAISTQLKTKKALQPGDILNKRGHVRLFSHRDSGGRFFVYEATGSHNQWKVIGRSYRLSQLKRYRPYKYKGIIANPTSSNKPKSIIKQIKWLVPRQSQGQLTLWLKAQTFSQVSTQDEVKIQYKISQLRQPVYLSLFNISPQGKWAILINNEKTEIGQTYSFPKTPMAWQTEQIYRREKRLRLESGREYFKAVISTKPISWTTFFNADSTIELQTLLGIKVLQIDVKE
ncbi:MAG: hypothetical protein VSS75_024680 [Candidatus Parabeggiatoa sp.]|nr:hypothetical protein [Candidatus Parabeggiatoa sp.]